MQNETIHIKNMVCNRCIKTVANILCNLSISHKAVQLGEVEINKPLTIDAKNLLKQTLESEGFELIDDKKSKLIEQIKKLVIEIAQIEYSNKRISISKFISGKLHHNYSYLSNLFSSVEGKTIENYFILQKVEKIKELLVYDELTISEISFKLGYSSTAHLSNQFKQITGLTPTYFKSIGAAKRKSIDTL